MSTPRIWDEDADYRELKKSHAKLLELVKGLWSDYGDDFIDSFSSKVAKIVANAEEFHK